MTRPLRHAAWLVPLAACAWLVAVLLAADRARTGDGSHLAGAELRLAQLLADGEIPLAGRLFVTLIAPQPPAGYVPGILAHLALGGGRLASLVAMCVSLLLLWDGYGRLAGSRLRGSAAWLLLLASPMTWLYVNQHGRDLVAGAVVVQAVSWLAASDGFRDRRAAAAFGAWLAVALLTKYTTPFFLWAPCLVAGLALVAASRREGARARWLNLGVAVGACLLLAGPWWVAYGARAIRYLTFSSGSPGDIANTRSAEEIRSIGAILYYPLALKSAVGWPGVALAVLGFGLRGAPRLAAVSAAGGVLALSALPAAQDRYALPALCAVVAGAAAWRGPWTLGPLLVALPLLHGTWTAHRPGVPVSNGIYEHPPASARRLDWPRSEAYPPEGFDEAAWGLEEAVRQLRAVQGDDRGTIGLLLSRAPNGPQFAQFLEVAGAAGMRWDFATVNLAYDPHGGRGQPERVFMGPLFDGSWPSREFDTLLALVPAQAEPELGAWLSSNARSLEERARWKLPNGGQGVVYRHTSR